MFDEMPKPLRADASVKIPIAANAGTVPLTEWIIVGTPVSRVPDEGQGRQGASDDERQENDWAVHVPFIIGETATWKVMIRSPALSHSSSSGDKQLPGCSVFRCRKGR